MRVRAFAVVAALMYASSASAQVMSEYMNRENEAVITGFVGSSFGDGMEEQHVDFGGAFSWLWRQSLGAEVLAGFTPDATLSNGVPDAQVHSYMANAIAALPLDTNGHLQPFVSGGVGALAFRVGDEEFDLDAPDETELGGNIGFGVMGFADRWGFRADARYFTELGDSTIVSSEAPAPVLQDFDFWRANVGIAYRW